MQLSISLQKDFTSLFQYSLPLCAVLSYPEATAWYYQHYMSIIGKESADHSIWFMYPDSFDYLSSNKANKMFDVVMYSNKEVNKDCFSFIQLIKENIKNHKYIIIFVDEFYISSSSKYNKVHYYHEYLVYGQDEIAKILNCIGFDHRNIYQKLEINKEEFYKGFLAALNKNEMEHNCINTSIFITFEMPDFTQISEKDTKSIIKKRLLEYAGSIYNSSDNPYFEQFFGKEDVKIGFLTIDLLIQVFEYLLYQKNYTMDVRQILMIYENRKSIYVRGKQILVTNEEVLMWKRYEEILKYFKIIYMEFIKYSYMLSGESFEINHNAIIHKKDKFMQMKKHLEYIKNIEFELLERLMDVIA